MTHITHEELRSEYALGLHPERRFQKQDSLANVLQCLEEGREYRHMRRLQDVKPDPEARR